MTEVPVTPKAGTGGELTAVSRSKFGDAAASAPNPDADGRSRMGTRWGPELTRGGSG